MRKKIGLALSSGGARSLAYIGIIKTLEKYHIPIDFIAGSSGGALMGGFYAKDKGIGKLEKITKQMGVRDFLWAFSDPRFNSGVLKGEKVVKFLEKYLGEAKIENTKIPFKAVATDLISGKPYIFETGLLSQAIRASCSLPFLFQPLKFEDKLLIDGGASIPVPVEVVKKMGADIVIAVNLYAIPKITAQKAQPMGIIDIMRSSANLVLHYLADEQAQKADIVINPQVPITSFTMIDFIRPNNFVKIGEEATEQAMPAIKKLMEVK